MLDDFRRSQDDQLAAFPGMRDFYAASDRHLAARLGRTTVTAQAPATSRGPSCASPCPKQPGPPPAGAWPRPRRTLPRTPRRTPHPVFGQFDPLALATDGERGPRTPSMSRARVPEDLDRILGAATDLLDGSSTFEQALDDYFQALRSAHRGDPRPIWSIDGVHRDDSRPSGSFHGDGDHRLRPTPRRPRPPRRLSR